MKRVAIINIQYNHITVYGTIYRPLAYGTDQQPRASEILGVNSNSWYE